MYRGINLIGIIIILIGMKHGGFGGEELYSFNVLLIGGCVQLYYQTLVDKENKVIECPDYISKKMLEDIKSLKENKENMVRKFTNKLNTTLKTINIGKSEGDIFKLININK
jgi:hypothetical protein